MRTVFRAGLGLVALLALAGCQTKGENLPLEVAKHRVITPEVQRKAVVVPASVGLPSEVVRVGTGLWQVGFRDYHLPQRMVRPVGIAAGVTFYSLAWDSEPYDRLLAPVPGGAGHYLEFLSVY